MGNALKYWLILALLAAPSLALANMAGTVTHLSGTLSAKRTDGTSKLLSVKSEVHQGDILTTEQNTYARVKFADGGEMVMRPNSQIVVAAFNYNSGQPASDSMVLNLLKGGLRALTGIIGKRSRDSVTYNTPTATIGIRGTHFGMLFCNNDCAGVPAISGSPPENGLHVDVSSGAVVVQNPGGQQVLSAGQFGYVRALNTPPLAVPPEQGIRVTMPPNISENNADGKALNNHQETKCSIQ